MQPSLGIVLATGSAAPRELLDFVVRMEQLDFDSAWVGDTLLRPIVESLTMLSAAAAVTEKITLGTAALLPALRRPVPAAQAIASLDQLSGGRLVLAVGAGFPNRSEPEYAAAQVPWKGRFARLDDTVALWRHLWRSDGPTAYHGDVLHFDELPPPTRPTRDGGPPIWLGGFSPSALERTGRLYDGWLPYPPDPGDYAKALAVVQSYGRPVTPALFATVLVTDSVERGREALDRYTRATYKWPLEVVETIQLLVAGPLPLIRERLHPYLQAGARHLVCRIGALGIEAQREQLELVRALNP